MSVNEIMKLFHISPQTVYRFRLCILQRNNGHKVPIQGQIRTAISREERFLCAVAKEDALPKAEVMIIQQNIIYV